MAMELLVVGGISDSWVGPVVAAGQEAMTVAVAEPDQTVDTSAVRILVGAPPDLAPKIRECPRLQWVQSTWAGVDALTGLVPKGVQVTPLKGVFGQAMSEFVLGWLLALERNIITRANCKHTRANVVKVCGGRTAAIKRNSEHRPFHIQNTGIGAACHYLKSCGSYYFDTESDT